jgi:hypothetical protein
MRAVVAFPNDQSYPGFVRSLGWSRILDPTRWDRRTGLRGALGRSSVARALTWAPDALWRGRERSRLGGDARGWDVAWHAGIPEDHDRLWSDCAAEHRVSLWKDRQYLTWRYDDNPDHDFEIVTLRNEGRLRALAVVLREGGRDTICDWGGPRAAGPAPARALVRAMCARAIEGGSDRLSFLGHDDGRFAAAFAGFAARPAPENVLTGRGLEDGALDVLIRDGRNWTMTFGDADYV